MAFSIRPSWSMKNTDEMVWEVPKPFCIKYI